MANRGQLLFLPNFILVSSLIHILVINCKLNEFIGVKNWVLWVVGVIIARFHFQTVVMRCYGNVMHKIW